MELHSGHEFLRKQLCFKQKVINLNLHNLQKYGILSSFKHNGQYHKPAKLYESHLVVHKYL